MSRFTAVARLLSGLVDDRVAPAAVIEVGHSSGAVWREAFGRLTYELEAPATTVETIFDLASLTKVIATTSLVMRAVDAGRVGLADPVREHLPLWRGSDREAVTIRHLLGHCSGLTSYLPFYRNCTGRREFEPAICDLPLEYPPATATVYSDLGFILLGFVLEDVLGARISDAAAAHAALFTSAPLLFSPPAGIRSRIAPTEIDPWRGRLLVGEVHDENCWALGGAAGHAGLFGTAEAVGDFARLVLVSFAEDTPVARRETMIAFAARTRDVPLSSRALGWDTMLPTSSCGTKLSPRAIGHTGFTGTSLWIDPAQDLYIVLLTNRVHPTRENERLRDLRGQIHDAVVGELANR